MSDKKHVLRVTAEDLETGEKETWNVPAGEYVIVTTAPAYVAHTQTFKNGQTVQLTIRDRRP